MIDSRRALIVVAAFVLMALGLPWGGNVPAASAQTISVTAADPPTGEQGTLNLNVIIKGKGFKNGAKAKFYKTGTTDPAGVNVKSTQYVSTTQLVALVDIADTAELAKFDIQVANTDGRTGKGTELFSVLAEKVSACTQPDPVPSPSPYVSEVPGYPGYLDGNFGSGGKVIGPRFTATTGFTGAPIAIDHADRIIVVGNRNFPCSVNQSGTELTAARYLPDGSPDAGFGVNGVVTIAFAGGNGIGTAVVVQADNKIVVAAQAKQTKSTASLPVIIRLDENGSLDSTFGSGGMFWMSLFGTKANGSVVSVALQAAGTAEKIVAAGWSDYGPRFVCRLNPNGAFDGTFNGSGYSLLNDQVSFNTVTIQSVGADQRIVVAGHSRDSLNHYVGTIWRYTGSGGPDTSFGGGTGIVRTSFHVEDGRSLGDHFDTVAIDSSNRLVAVGSMSYSLVPGDLSITRTQVVLARYDVDGDPDTSFGLDGSGRAWAPLSTIGKDVAKDMALQADGLILVAGYTYLSGNSPDAGALWRFNPDGAVDATFGDGGWVTDPVVSGARLTYVTGMALQADGRIVCGGHIATVGSPSIYYVVLARFWQQ
jgi:uncharacterized delta-60 repeat protein